MPFVLFLFVIALCPTVAWSDDLLEIYELAQRNDPVIGAAEAGYRAQREFVPQARASLLPVISMNGSTAWNERDFPGRVTDMNPDSPTFGERVKIPGQEFNTHGWGAQLNQPLIDVESWHTLGSARSVVDQAELNLRSADQTLVLRVVQAYLNVLRAQDLLDSTIAEQSAVKRQLEQVQQRFDVGLVAITDVLEAQAAYDNSVVRRIQADGDQVIFFETLKTLTGVDHQELARVSSALPIVDPNPRDSDEWVAIALAENLNILAARAQLDAASKTVRARRAGHYPRIDATYSHTHFVTGGVSFLGSKIDEDVYGLQMTLPIYQGGFVNSRTREARALEEQAEQLLLDQERTVERDTRNLFQAVATDVVRVKARYRAIKSSESALDATETGYEVGTRNIVDVLRAQQILYASEFDYADSRYGYLLNLMALKQTVGYLDREDVIELNRFTDAADPVIRRTYSTAADGETRTN